jgi:hypothetical protein
MSNPPPSASAPEAPLIEKLDRGPAGAAEFERLMHQLLGAHGAQKSFAFEPMLGKGRGGGFDGIVRGGGVPGFSGPVAFELRCVRDNLRRVEIERALERASRLEAIAHWILVTPRALSASEAAMLAALGAKTKLQVHHWGPLQIEPLLRAVPALLARYYPEAARALLPGYDGVDFRELAAHYRAKVTLLHRDLRTLGLPPEALARGRDAHGHVRLRDIFVPLRFGGDDNTAPESLGKLLDGRSVVVLGDPGMGKSTLLAFIALLYAGGASLEGVEISPRAVPLSIPLRDFARLAQARPGLSFLDYLEERAKSDLGLPRAHRAFFESALRMGEAVVLLDGLDEVGGAAARAKMRDKIVAFRADYPSCPFWVSARIHGYGGDGRLPVADFAERRILRLDDAQVDDFIARWYTLLAPPNPRERDDLQRSLRDAIHRTPSVRRLASTPLLLTLMALLHLGARKLPRDRGELYDTCVRLLLETWQEAKRSPSGEAEPHAEERLGLHVHTQKDYLAHLAFAMQSRAQPGGDEARGMIPRSEALECLAARHLERSRRERPALILAEAREEMSHFLDYVADRTGLLVDRGGGLLSFIHLSFQEYLAAWVFTCLPPPPDGHHAFFRSHLGDPVWEEVLLLRLYLLLQQGERGEEAFDTIIAILLRALERDDRPAGWLTLARALRDDLTFSQSDRKVILEKALSLWLLSPRSHGAWYSVLEEIVLFAEKAREALRELLVEQCRRGSAKNALAALHLTRRLFGFPPDLAHFLGARDDLDELLPDLVVFREEPGMAALLDRRATLAHVANAFSAIDSPDLHRLTLGWVVDETLPSSPLWLVAAAGTLTAKILEELESRCVLASRSPATDREARERGSTEVVHEAYSITTPFSALRALDPEAWELLDGAVRVPRGAFPGLLRPNLAWERLPERARQCVSFDRAVEERLASLAEAALAGIPDSDPSLARNAIAGASVFATGGVWDAGLVMVELLRSFDGAPPGNAVPRLESAIIDDLVLLWVHALLGRNWPEKVPDPHFDIGHVRAGTSAPSTAVQVSLAKEAALAALLRDLWTGPMRQQLWSIHRSLALTHPREDAPLSAWQGWLRKHPLGTFAIALAWDDYLASLPPSRAPLAGLHGALTLLHAAHAALMSGLSLDGPRWQSLLRALDLGDPRLAFAYALHELCHFRDQPMHAATLAALLRDPPELLAPLLEAAGLRPADPDALVELVDDPLRGSLPPLPGEPPRPLFAWAHLSDLDFGSDAAGHEWDRTLVLDAIRDDLARRASLSLPSPKALFVTGDIAWRGQPEHYALARAWLLDLAHSVDLGAGNVFVVPGNHDVDLTVDRARAVARLVRDLREGAEPLDDALADPEDRALLTRRQQPYLAFAAGLAPACLAPPEEATARLFWSHRFTTRRGLRVRLAGLNTALLAGADVPKGKLRLGKEGLARAFADPPRESGDELVIVLSHHTLREGWLADEQDASRWIQSRAHVHLAGQAHEAELELLRRGGGSGFVRIVAGAAHGEARPPGVAPSHGYNLAAVYAAPGGGLVLRIWPRRWSDKHKQFRSDLDHTDEGRSFVEHELGAVRFVPPSGDTGPTSTAAPSTRRF